MRASAAIPLSLLVSTWVAMGFLLQGLQDGWERPWALTYAIHSGYTLSLIPYAILRRLRVSRGEAPLLPPLRSTLLFTLGLSLLSSCVAITWYASLNGTSVPGNSAVYQSCAAFTLIFSVLFLGERVTLVKGTACAVSLAGVALVTVGASGGTNNRDTVAGYAWVTASTLLYAFYEVIFARLFLPRKAACGENDRLVVAEAHDASETLLPEAALDDDAGAGSHAGSLAAAETSALVLGLMGVWTFCLQWPIFFIANAAQLEPLDLAPMSKAKILAIAVGCDAIFNLSLLWAISTSSPFATSLATTLVVPASIVADLIINQKLPTPLAAVGMCLILGAVAALNAPPAFWRSRLGSALCYPCTCCRVCVQFAFIARGSMRREELI
jgi:drug/metabolite transporter (DMT)-like permease